MFKNAIPTKDKEKRAAFSVFTSIGANIPWGPGTETVIIIFFYFEELSLKIIGRGWCDEDILTY